MPAPGLYPALRRQRKVLIAVFAVVVLVTVAVLQAFHLWETRDRALQLAEQRAANLAFVLSEYVRGSFAVVDASLRQLAIHAHRVGGPAAPALLWDPILAAARTSIAGSGSFSVSDANGIIRHSTQRLIVGQSRRDNYIFKELSRSTRDDLVVDRPMLSITEPRRFIIPLGRRLTSVRGAFDGTVVATVLPSAYQEFFRTVDVGRDGIISVLHPDGVVLFREPSEGDPINEPASGHPVAIAARGSMDAGVVKGPLQSGGPPFISGFRVTTTPALVVAVSLSRDEVLDDWRDEALSSALGLAALAITLTAMTFVAFRQINARTRVEHELADVQRLEAERLRESNERLEEALAREQRARQDIEAASRLKDEFLMTVSHELRTPLTAIFGWVRMLGSEALPTDQRAQALDAIERNARAQARLIEDLLDVSQAISGHLQLDVRPVEVRRVVLAAVETLRPALNAKAIQFDREIGDDLGVVLGDADRLQQVVWNLLSNAAKFTPEGGRVGLRAARSPDGQHVEIVVSDTGVGIAREFVPHLFERFQQAEAGTRRRYGGLGLGLAIVRHFVELHGGRVAAESDGEGLGATFRVVLPLRVASATPD